MIRLIPDEVAFSYNMLFLLTYYLFSSMSFRRKCLLIVIE